MPEEVRPDLTLFEVGREDAIDPARKQPKPRWITFAIGRESGDMKGATNIFDCYLVGSRWPPRVRLSFGLLLFNGPAISAFDVLKFSSVVTSLSRRATSAPIWSAHIFRSTWSADRSVAIARLASSRDACDVS